jgi:arsenate reductase (thioredoxin)
MTETDNGKKRVLILCTGNSARSQMAEGFWRHYGGGQWEVCSAGVAPGRVAPTAIQVMQEAGVDISDHYSKSVSKFVGQNFDLVVTVCDNAAVECPSFPGAQRQVHWPFDDPPHIPEQDENFLDTWRAIRDRIEARITDWLRTEG